MRALIYSIILCFFTFMGFHRDSLAAQKQYEILLKSRTFTPPEGIYLNLSENRSSEERAHAYMQFKKAPDPETRAALSALGIRLLHYIPHNTWFVSLPSDISLASLNIEELRWAGRILPEDKIASVLQKYRVGDPGEQNENELVMVRYFMDARPGDVKKRLEQLGAVVMGEIPGAHRIVVSIQRKKIFALGRDDAVQWVEPVAPSGESESSGIRAFVQADVAQKEFGLSGRGVSVGVFDNSHVYADHPDLFSRVHRGDNDPAYYRPHATAVAGLIGGNGTVVHDYRGIAPDAEIFTYSYSAQNGHCGLFQNYFNDLYLAVQKEQIDVAHNSWGNRGCVPFGYGEYMGLCAALDGAVHGDFGRPVTIVFSAGNERCVRRYDDRMRTSGHQGCIEEKAPPFINYGTINHPKSSKNILVVGAVDSLDCRMSVYSSWGPAKDGSLKPDIVAPGHQKGADSAGVSEPLSAGSFFKAPHYPVRERTYGYFGLTSCAAAVASGSIALLLEAYFDKYSDKKRPLPSSVRALLVHTARDLDDSTPWYNLGPDYASGYGLLQIGDAIEQMRQGFFTEDIIYSTQSKMYHMEVRPGTADVKITLAWDDPPAVENASRALVNDLDLVVHDPEGKRHFPWTLDPQNPSADAVRTKQDNLNNTEQVFVENDKAPPGIWEVFVSGKQVPEGPQAFSLASSAEIFRLLTGPPCPGPSFISGWLLR
jgi:hypothetical protein